MENTYKFNLAGMERKRLAGAISDILNQPVIYDGAPLFTYRVDGYTVDRNGAVTGEYSQSLMAGLETRGFVPELETAPESETVPEPDCITVEYPLDGFTPEATDNLCKLINAKENLLMSALGADALPIQILADRISFPWFTLTDDSERVKAYSQFIAALCETAKSKKRVSAKPREGFENEKFSMRIFLVSIGCVGAEYKYLRRIMGENLGGNSAWRYGKPEGNGAADKE